MEKEKMSPQLKVKDSLTVKRSRLIKTLHEKWAKKNGYINNDKLNSENTIGFKNGAER